MIYKSLETIPYKLFFKIEESKDFSLLSTEPIEDDLSAIWEAIEVEHLELASESNGNKIFNLEKKIGNLSAKHIAINIACDCLDFDKNDEMIQLLKSYKYTLRDDYFDEDIDMIRRESNSLKIKIDRYAEQLPKPTNNTSEKMKVDDLLAMYCAILGFNIGDFNTITYTAVIGFENQVKNKLKSLDNGSK